jgi:hypothetical protein
LKRLTRVHVVLALVGAGIAAFAAIAIGARSQLGKPQPGNYGYSHTYEGGAYHAAVKFKVVRSPTKLKKFVVVANYCGGAYKLPKPLAVKPNGKFAFSGTVKNQDGNSQLVDVQGKFSSKRTAKGSAYTGCPLATIDFIAKKGGNNVVDP